MPHRILLGISEATELCMWIMLSSSDIDLAKKAERVLKAQKDALAAFKKMTEDVPVQE